MRYELICNVLQMFNYSLIGKFILLECMALNVVLIFARDYQAKDQRDKARREIQQLLSVKSKLGKDLARVTEERNTAVQEYTLVSSAFQGSSNNLTRVLLSRVARAI